VYTLFYQALLPCSGHEIVGQHVLLNDHALFFYCSLGFAIFIFYFCLLPTDPMPEFYGIREGSSLFLDDLELPGVLVELEVDVRYSCASHSCCI